MEATSSDSNSHVRFDRVTFTYESRPVLYSLSCAFPRGKISVILGGSGSGKSTILRLVGRLMRPQAGRIFVDEQDITQLSERKMYEVRRKIGMMFQGGALLDSYTVFENLALPLREYSRLDEEQIAAEVHDRLKAVELENVDQMLPGALSGGMLRRVALARAIIRKPGILLCDEPFSGLDPGLTRRIESLLVQLNRQSGMTMVVVSHHVPSTLRMADHVLLLLPDRTVEGSPDELRHSADPEVMEFLSEDVLPPTQEHGTSNEAADMPPGK